MRLNDDHYFPHEADIGIVGRGRSLEAAFEDAAVAMFGIMADLTAIREIEQVEFEFEESDIELAFITWLNRLLAESYRLNLVFCRFAITKQSNHWLATAWGQVWNSGITHGIEVKGATLTMLSAKQDKEGWEVRCVVDV